MLQQILTHTPIRVWAVLAFLLYRGLLSSVEREMTLRRVLIMPIVMLALSLQGIASAFGGEPAAASIWLAGMLAGGAMAWRRFNRDSICIDAARRVILQRGSWMPLLLMLGVFCTRYAVGVALAIYPTLAQQTLFAAGVCALYGVFNGLFLGQAMRVVMLYRQASMPASTAAGVVRP